MKTRTLKLIAFLLVLFGVFSACTKMEVPTQGKEMDTVTRAEFSETPYFYYYEGEKQYFDLDTKYVFVSVADETDAKVLDSHGIKYQPLSIDIPEGRRGKTEHRRFWTTVSLQEEMTPQGYWAKLSEIGQWSKDIIVAPYFKNRYQDKIGLSNFLYVKLKEAGDLDLLKQAAEKERAVIVYQNEFMPLWYVLSVTNDSECNAMELSNRLYESGLFQYAEPDLLVDDKASSANDPYYADQWNLNNTGQYGGTAGVDINIEQAWAISTGSNVTVAVLDTGIDLSHPDLAANIHSLSYDSERRSSPQQIKENHGTAVAGIIGARRNNLVSGNYEGVAGVAPNAKIMSVSNSLAGTTLSREARADGINWARLNGADVINNSWGSSTRHSVIDNAIYNAITYGRGGKGCVVVFASGNDNLSTISYPASLSNVIAVGAISYNGMRKSPSTPDGEYWWGSNYGSALDVMAPGVRIPTIDRLGSVGYSSGDYYSSFNGTSSAAPHVAGVAALMLSVDPDLTREEVTMIIERTAQKISPGTYSYTSNSGRPNGTWNNQMGYGLLDAYAAVHAAWSVANLPPSNWYGMHLTLGSTPEPDEHEATVYVDSSGSGEAAYFTLPTDLVNTGYTYYWSFDRNGNSTLHLPASTYVNRWNASVGLVPFFGADWTLNVQCRVYDGATLISIPKYTLHVEFF